MLLDIVTLVSFVLIGVIVFVLAFWLFGKRRRLRSSGEDLLEATAEPSAFTRAMASAVPLLPRELEGIRDDLKHAGYYRPAALAEYLATRNSLIALTLIAAGALAVLADPKSTLPQMFALAGAVTAIVCHMLPRLILNRQAKSRLSRIEQGLPDALDVTSMCLSGGLPLRTALERCASEIRLSRPEIAVEFEIIRRHAEANSMAMALRSFAQRIETPDVKAFASLVIQTERMGVHVGRAIADFAESIRRTHQQRAEERAARAGVLLIFPIIFCLAPPIWILLAGPPILQIRTFFTEENQPGGLLDVNIDELPFENPR
ncbi:MAG: type II secretion system F family protein [Planctomycetales bacterium]